MPSLSDQIIQVPIEIRRDVIVKITLPANLTHAEAEKIAAVIVAAHNPEQPIRYWGRWKNEDGSD